MTIPAEKLPTSVANDWRGITSLTRIDRKRIVGDKETNERCITSQALIRERLS
ncbi:MAG: hypothetical protein K2X08_02640 [Chlamydiales bacterium]|nr:hypothetical protein [Chlamydiales bacterium]